MVNTKTQKPLKISKTKSENIAEWFESEAHWKVLSECINFGKTAIFKYKKNMKAVHEEKDGFEALAETLTLKQLNAVIEVYNDYVEHPEKYEKPRKKIEIDLEDQANKIARNNDMQHLKYNGHYEANENTPDKAEDKTEPKVEPKKAKTTDTSSAEGLSKQELLDKQAKEVQAERERINQLPAGSDEREAAEQQFKAGKADRMKAFWDAQKQERQKDKE